VLWVKDRQTARECNLKWLIVAHGYKSDICVFVAQRVPKKDRGPELKGPRFLAALGKLVFEKGSHDGGNPSPTSRH